MTEPGLSARNPRVVAAARLHRADERRRTGLTLLEGPKLLEEARRAQVVVREVFSLDTDTVVSQAALERLSSTRTPQSPVAVVEIPERPLTPGRSALVAWDIADPGNLGTIIRTAAAFALDVITTESGADPWSPKALRAGAGGHFQTGLGTLQLDGYLTVAATVDGGIEPWGLPPGRLAILIGSEAHGLPPDVVASADMRVSIPMPGEIESLNAASAAAILSYELSKRLGETSSIGGN